MLDLLDYRRRVFESYRTIRLADDPSSVTLDFRRAKDDLFKHHSQSPLSDAQKAAFTGLDYYPYNPAWRVVGTLSNLDRPVEFELDIGEDGRCRLVGFAQVDFTTPAGAGHLTLYWIAGYGGGLFLPFRDATAGSETYGGGRYLYDTIKGADLSSPHHPIEQSRFLLDFNLAYNPSCAYNPRWVCPLAPPTNHLAFPVPAGERVPQKAS